MYEGEDILRGTNNVKRIKVDEQPAAQYVCGFLGHGRSLIKLKLCVLLQNQNIFIFYFYDMSVRMLLQCELWHNKFQILCPPPTPLPDMCAEQSKDPYELHFLL